jgi:hypothetical protein
MYYVSGSGKKVERLNITHYDNVSLQLTMADLAFLRTVDAFDKLELKLTETLAALRKRIEATPKIAAYLKSRPVTEM